MVVGESRQKIKRTSIKGDNAKIKPKAGFKVTKPKTRTINEHKKEGNKYLKDLLLRKSYKSVLNLYIFN